MALHGAHRPGDASPSRNVVDSALHRSHSFHATSELSAKGGFMSEPANDLGVEDIPGKRGESRQWRQHLLFWPTVLGIVYTLTALGVMAIEVFSEFSKLSRGFYTDTFSPFFYTRFDLSNEHCAFGLARVSRGVRRGAMEKHRVARDRIGSADCGHPGRVARGRRLACGVAKSADRATIAAGLRTGVRPDPGGWLTSADR